MKKKLALTICAVVMMLGIAASETYSVFQADGDDVQTHISTNNLDIELVGEGVHAGNEAIVEVDLLPNQVIQKQMAVSNVKETTLYTRVTIRKYWLDENGHKDFTADASEIGLNYNKEAWLEEFVDTENGEEVVLYYKKPLKAGETSVDFLNSIQVPANLNNADMGRKFVLDVKVDAVQYLDGVNGMLTQWGVLATLENDEIVEIVR